jgi:late competence protein required for DNA uptake (superfamily II DNA/RNA helicase)
MNVTSEVDRTPDIERKQKVKELLRSAKTKILFTPAIQERTEQLVNLGFKYFDALHLAFAESDAVDIFLKTDD